MAVISITNLKKFYGKELVLDIPERARLSNVSLLFCHMTAK